MTILVYEDVLKRLNLPLVLQHVFIGRIKIPEADIAQPPNTVGFPPAVIPLWSEPSGPFYVAYFKHWFSSRAETYVKVDVESRFRCCEIARAPLQLFQGIGLFVITSGGNEQELRRFLGETGVRYEDIDRASMDTGDSLTGLRKLEAGEWPVEAYEDPGDYPGEFPAEKLDARKLANSCAFEWSTEMRERLRREQSGPEWFWTRDQPALFRRLLASGDLAGAWLSLTSEGWMLADARIALRSLAQKAGDRRFTALAEAWCAVDFSIDRY